MDMKIFYFIGRFLVVRLLIITIVGTAALGAGLLEAHLGRRRLGVILMMLVDYRLNLSAQTAIELKHFRPACANSMAVNTLNGR